jgi:hypothetical protein
MIYIYPTGAVWLSKENGISLTQTLTDFSLQGALKMSKRDLTSNPFAALFSSVAQAQDFSLNKAAAPGKLHF